MFCRVVSTADRARRSGAVLADGRRVVYDAAASRARVPRLRPSLRITPARAPRRDFRGAFVRSYTERSPPV